MYFTGHSVPCSGHNTARPTHPHGGGVHAVQELLRFLASTREAQEIEHKRRIAWEQEQEAKYKLRQAEMERRMVEMQQEITALKARVAFSSPTSSAPSVTVPQLQYSAPQQPTPNTSPTLSHPSTPGTFSPPMAEASSYATRFINVNPLGNTRAHSEAGTESEEDDEGPAQYRARRKNHHDTRCLTIQVLVFNQLQLVVPHVCVVKHAMRNHLLRVMMLDTDKELPDSHVEGTPVGPDEPVRFVWDKTPRQSVHNGRMKERVLKDLKANRKLYKHVPDKDFGKKTLDSVFDQAFVTFRQKFRAQRDDSAARAHKQREEAKAQRARRLSRRKVVCF